MKNFFIFLLGLSIGLCTHHLAPLILDNSPETESKEIITEPETKTETKTESKEIITESKTESKKVISKPKSNDSKAINSTTSSKSDSTQTVNKIINEVEKIEIRKVNDNGNAMVKVEQSIKYSFNRFDALLINDGKDGSFYDDQMIKIPSNKCVKQIGIFKYKEFDRVKTIPIIKIVDK